jgi:molybdate transport system ATP-binding protein
MSGVLAASLTKQLSPSFTLEVEFAAGPGITIVFGESGSGKSTLLRCLAGLLTPDAGRVSVAGTVWFDGAVARNLPPSARRVGYVFQDLALFPHMSVRDNLAYGVPRSARSDSQRRIEAIAERFRIAHLLGRKPGAISGGESQRTALARALVTDPALLLLDEPLSALDHVTQSRIIEDLRAWNAAHSIPILYVTHAHREVFALGERVLVLEQGRMLAAGTPHEVMDTPLHESLARLAGFENFFSLTVLALRADAGVMHCRIDGTATELEIPMSAAAIGQSVRVAIRAGDILLAKQEPQGLSARNIIRGQLRSLTREGALVVAHVEMVAAGEPGPTLAHPATFTVHLTPSAIESLHLREGDALWVVIKTHSCRLVS